MKVTFVFPDWLEIDPTAERGRKSDDSIGRLSFAIAALSAGLKQNGHETDLIHVSRKPLEEDFKTTLQSYKKTQVFAFSFTEVEKSWVKDMGKWIKDETGAFTIGGGIYPTLQPLRTITDLGLDAACVGEGDRALPQLCSLMEQGRDYLHVDNLFINHNGNQIENPIGGIIENPDDLPRYDYEIFDPGRLKFLNSNLPRLYYLCTRNCVYGCTFCSNAAKRKAMRAGAKYMRRFSPERVINDLEYYLDRFPQVKLVHFADEIIHQDKKWFRELMQLYTEKIGLPWRSYAMLSILDEETVGIMARGNCVRVNVGLEAGSMRIRKLYNRPPISNREIIEKVKLLKDNGIDVHTSTLLNAPTETLDEMLQTIKLAAEVNTDIALTGIVVPYEGTQLHKMAKEKSLLQNTAYENTGASIKPADCTEDKILFIYNAYRFMVAVYKAIFKTGRPLGKLLFPVADAIFKYKRLPHRALIRINHKYLRGKLLNRAYRKTETKLGRDEGLRRRV